MNDGSEEGDYRRAALVRLRPDSEHGECDIFNRRFRDIYSSRLHVGLFRENQHSEALLARKCCK